MRSFVEAVKYAALKPPEAGFGGLNFQLFRFVIAEPVYWHKAAEKFKNVRQSTSH
jgi:hypothetical protein